MARRRVDPTKPNNFVVMYIDGDEIQAAHFKHDEFDEMNEFIRVLKDEQDITENQVIVLQNVERVHRIRTSIELYELDEPFRRRDEDDDD